MDRTIDYAPLFAPASAEEVADYRAATLAARPPDTAQQLNRVVGWVVGGALVLGLFPTVLFPLVVLSVQAFSPGGDPLLVLGALPGVALVVLAVVFTVRSLIGARAAWTHRIRMARFAAANGLVYEPASPPPSYPGSIFNRGSSRAVSDHFRTAEGRYWDFGNYTWVTGSGKSRTTHRWGFLALHLDRALPHMLLDARANNSLFGSNLPEAFARDQVLSLEGDFDRYFTLYCPKQYERDALYVFTPDLMALLIDEAAPYDVEIVDRWMFVYAGRPFPLADAATYQRLLRIVSTVGAKTLSQTDRYRDDRIGDFAANVVAPRGQRLRHGRPWPAILIAIAVAGFWFWVMISSFTA